MKTSSSSLDYILTFNSVALTILTYAPLWADLNHVWTSSVVIALVAHIPPLNSSTRYFMN